MRATAVLGSDQHMRWTALFDRDQGRAGSSRPGGPAEIGLASNQVSNSARRYCRTPTDVDGRSSEAQACCDAGGPH
jgi:hypothetical protein